MTAHATFVLHSHLRFDFNIYSYESEWTMGLEWWQRRAKGKRKGKDASLPSGVTVASTQIPGQEPIHIVPSTPQATVIPPSQDEVDGVVKARISTSTVRNFHLDHTSFALIVLFILRTSR